MKEGKTEHSAMKNQSQKEFQSIISGSSTKISQAEAPKVHVVRKKQWKNAKLAELTGKVKLLQQRQIAENQSEQFRIQHNTEFIKLWRGRSQKLIKVKSIENSKTKLQFDSQRKLCISTRRGQHKQMKISNYHLFEE